MPSRLTNHFRPPIDLMDTSVQVPRRNYSTYAADIGAQRVVQRVPISHLIRETKLDLQVLDKKNKVMEGFCLVLQSYKRSAAWYQSSEYSDRGAAGVHDSMDPRHAHHSILPHKFDGTRGSGMRMRPWSWSGFQYSKRIPGFEPSTWSC